MGTYIIHFDDKPWEDLDDELYYRCFEIPWFSTTKTTISRLTPYTEDSAYAHGYTEAESKYREIRDELEKQAYQKGLSDAWEAVRKVIHMPEADLLNIFDQCYAAVCTSVQVFLKYDASECIEKIRAYEQGKEEQIQVGDEVRSIHHGWTAVVSAIDRECMTLMDTNGELGDGYDVNRFTKTGRHFPEIAEVLQKMKETDNG